MSERAGRRWSPCCGRLVRRGTSGSCPTSRRQTDPDGRLPRWQGETFAVPLGEATARRNAGIAEWAARTGGVAVTPAAAETASEAALKLLAAFAATARRVPYRHVAAEAHDLSRHSARVDVLCDAGPDFGA